MLCIRRATILTPEVQIDNGVLLIEHGRILAVGDDASIATPDYAEVIDAGGLLVTPGFIDLQLNGAFGDDFTLTPDTIWRVAAGLPRWGVTSFLPTIITSPLQQVAQAQETLEGGPPAGWQGSIPLGLHCEGPFLNPQKKGAHNPAHLRLPTVADVAAWSPEAHVRLVTLAPELPGALEVIRNWRRAASSSAPAIRWQLITKPRQLLPRAFATARISSTPCRRSNTVRQVCPARC